MPPAIISIKIVANGKKTVGLWLPLILVWVVCAVPFLIILPLLALADLITRAAGRTLNLCALTFGTLGLLGELKGLEVSVINKEKNNVVKIFIG
jgi:hypothetical protein